MIVRESVERGNEKCDGLLPPLSRNVSVHVRARVMGMCSKLKKQRKAGTVKNSVQTGPGSVYPIPCGQVASINPPPQTASVFACV